MLSDTHTTVSDRKLDIIHEYILRLEARIEALNSVSYRKLDIIHERLLRLEAQSEALNSNFYRVKAETDHEERQVIIAARDFMRNQIIILAVAATFVGFERYIDPYWFLKFSIYYVLLRCLFIILLD